MERQTFRQGPCDKFFLHIPLNFGAAMKRNVGRIHAVGAFPEPVFILTDENSLWGADVLYIEVTKEVPGMNMATISGSFLSKVFKEPYRNIRNWITEVKNYIGGKGKSHVAILAQV